MAEIQLKSVSKRWGNFVGVDDFNLTIPPRTTVAITGESGTGKSLLLFTAGGLADISAGEIYLDGQDIATLRRQDVRRAVGVMSSDVPLLAGSLRRNLIYRMPGATTGQLDDLIAYCSLGPLVDSLPKGVLTKIGEGGGILSSGWRARVELARALMGKPRILLLDEPDARLDQDGRDLLTAILAKRVHTSVIVTDHPLRLREADIVIECRRDGAPVVHHQHTNVFHLNGASRPTNIENK